MKILNLTADSKIYTSNVYLIMGEWNTLDDLNTLIDVGQDIEIFNKIDSLNSGLGKNKVDQVILTHSHYDHAGIIDQVIQKYSPKVFAFNKNVVGITKQLIDGDKIKVGDSIFEVFHITTHSSDSICLYSEQLGIMFSGDTQFPLDSENQKSIERMKKINISKIYPGHGNVIEFNGKKFNLIKKNN